MRDRAELPGEDAAGRLIPCLRAVAPRLPSSATDTRSASTAGSGTPTGYEDDLPPEQRRFLDENRRFFDAPLPGRTEPLGSPNGATTVGVVGVDTEYVARYRS